MLNVGFGAIDPFARLADRGMVIVDSEDHMNRLFRKAWISLGDERGATMVEYAFMVALIALVVITGAAILGTALDSKFTDFGTAVQNT